MNKIMNMMATMVIIPVWISAQCLSPLDSTLYSEYELCKQQHSFGSTTTTDFTDSTQFALLEPKCAYVNISNIANMPTIKTADAHAILEYFDDNGYSFSKKVIINAQGNSSLNLPKKNLAIDFCEDEWLGDATTQISFGDWVTQDSYHLKAYYIDWLRGVGAVGYRIFDDIVADHNTYLQRADVKKYDSKARCYPAGFPCIVYLNGEFYGIYSWQLKKHRDNMGQNKKTAEHIHLDGTINQESFWGGTIDWTQFEIRNPKNLYSVETKQVADSVMEYQKYDGDNPSELIDETMQYYDPTNKDHVRTAQVKHSIERLAQSYSILRNLKYGGANNETVLNALSEYYDYQSLLDYAAFHFVVSNSDGFGKNWQWFTYDGIKWFLSPYDLDMTFGNFFTGAIVLPPQYNRFDPYNTIPWNGPFWVMNMCGKDDIKNRYHSLRQSGSICAETIITYLNDWYSRVGAENYDKEYDKWSNSYCIRPTIASSGWTTDDDWTDYSTIPAYDPNRTYQPGERCTMDYRIWTATDTSTGIFPYIQLGYVDNLERYEEWITERLRLIDEYFEYIQLPTNIENKQQNATVPTAYKQLRDGQIVIIHNNIVYSVLGNRR